MIFNYILGLQEIEKENVKINNREAIRAITLKKDKILMVHTNKGDYKFPGGGVNEEESHEETLKREVMEETGYIIKKVKDKVGEIIERKLDEYEEDSVFQMTSHYYLCEVLNEKTNQQLDNYEAELDFQAVWVQLEEVIEFNEKVIEKDGIGKNPWVYRETEVLKALKKHRDDLEHIYY
ncbi:NUDIX domain-containing protein [Clostridium sp.]|uniref:NUDIX hydrolase n=1 Tax=Clostridium sp. TaxID=1506 RepID=UPI003217EA8C